MADCCGVKHVDDNGDQQITRSIAKNAESELTLSRDGKLRHYDTSTERRVDVDHKDGDTTDVALLWPSTDGQIAVVVTGAVENKQILARGGQGAEIGDTGEATLLTISVPATLIAAGGIYRFRAAVLLGGGTSYKTLRFKVNGTTIHEYETGSGAAGRVYLDEEIRVAVTGASGSYDYDVQAEDYASEPEGETYLGEDTETGVDMTSGLTIVLTGELNDAADTLQLRSYSLEN